MINRNNVSEWDFERKLKETSMGRLWILWSPGHKETTWRVRRSRFCAPRPARRNLLSVGQELGRSDVD